MDTSSDLIERSNPRYRTVITRYPSSDIYRSYNNSPSPCPLATSEPTGPTLLLIAYDRKKPPAVTLALDYNLQTTLSTPKHIRALPVPSSFLAISQELLTQAHVTRQLNVAENEIKEKIKHLQAEMAYLERTDSNSSGEVVGDWVQDMMADSLDAVQSAAAICSSPDEAAAVDDDEPLQLQLMRSCNGSLSYRLPDEEPVLHIGFHCVSGCYESVIFVEELARRRWPLGWAVKVEHHRLFSTP